jgi:hypothetical protein
VDRPEWGGNVTFTDTASQQIAVIDSRIRAAKLQENAFGTVQSLASTGVDVQVVFDGSTVSMPVKALGNVPLAIGDRVTLDLYVGRTWVITGNFTRRRPGFVHDRLFATSGTTTSSSFVDYPGSPTIQFIKQYDESTVVVKLTIGLRVPSVTDTIGKTAFRISGTPGTETETLYTAADFESSHIVFNTANKHEILPGSTHVALDAGDYTFTARWRRVSGTGTLTSDSNDLLIWHVEEIL